MLLLPLPLLKLPGDDDRCRRARYLFQLLWLQPALRHHQLLLDLLDAYSVVIECVHEACPDLAVVGLLIEARLGAMVVPEEAVLQGERVGHLELLPYDDAGSSQLAWVNGKAAGRKTDEF